MKTNVIPYGNRIGVIPLAPKNDVSSGGIVMPVEKPYRTGTVVSVGLTTRRKPYSMETENVAAADVKPGDTIAFSRHAGFELDGVLLIEEEHIFAILTTTDPLPLHSDTIPSEA